MNTSGSQTRLTLTLALALALAVSLSLAIASCGGGPGDTSKSSEQMDRSSGSKSAPMALEEQKAEAASEQTARAQGQAEAAIHAARQRGGKGRAGERAAAFAQVADEEGEAGDAEEAGTEEDLDDDFGTVTLDEKPSSPRPPAKIASPSPMDAPSPAKPQLVPSRDADVLVPKVTASLGDFRAALGKKGQGVAMDGKDKDDSSGRLISDLRKNAEKKEEKEADESEKKVSKKKSVSAKNGYFKVAVKKPVVKGNKGSQQLNNLTRNSRDHFGYHRDGLKAGQHELSWRNAPLPQLFDKPKRFLPRMFYFEPTYLGGNAGVAERLRRLQSALPDARQRIVEAARSHPQDFDPPQAAGIGLSARLATPWIDRPQRVLLQVGLQGSRRYGWRRPPLDVVLVLDAPLMRGSLKAAKGLVRAAMKRLGPQDRMGVVTVTAGGGAYVMSPVQRTRELAVGLDRALEDVPRATSTGATGPAQAMRRAGELLRTAAEQAAQIPGTQTVWLITAGGDKRPIQAASRTADWLTRKGIVTSVIEMGASGSARGGAWWQVASKGHGNYHRPKRGRSASAIDEELDALSKVVARLLRVNVRMASGVKAIRVIGSRVLDPDEVRRLKAREKAVDKALSKTMGLKADRGDDDDGIQTNLPYFYGDDSHVILVELWVEKPGAVADITIKYKDMVNLKNATAQVSVAIHGTPRGEVANVAVARNFAGFQLAERLIKAGYKVKHGRRGQAHALLAEAAALATTGRETQMVVGFQAWLSQGGTQGLSEALVLAGKRQVGQPSMALVASGHSGARR